MGQRTHPKPGWTNLENLPQFLRIPTILEVSIGHALTADALMMGLTHAVKAYLDVIATANQQHT